MVDRIWQRRVRLEKNYRDERDVLLAPLREKYALLRDALTQECEDSEAGHKWCFLKVGVGDGVIYRCTFCGKTKVLKCKLEKK